MESTRTTILAGTVITMTDRGVLRDQAVTVDDGRITAIEPRETSRLDNPIVDWRDRTLLPGLADCHVHVEERADMLLNLAHGITLVRNMRGKPWHLAWQRAVAAGVELGPHLVTSTPMADGRGAPGTTVWPDSALIEDRAGAHQAVQRWAELGYQQVKAYQWLRADALAGLGEACRDTGLPLVGHCPQVLTVHEAIDLGQTGFEHLNNYEYGALHAPSQERLDAFFAQGMSYGRGRNRFSPEAAEAASDIDEHKIRDLAQRLAADDIMSCPTLIVLHRALGQRDMSDPRLRHIDPAHACTWKPGNDFRFNALTAEERQITVRLFDQRGLRILAALREAGAPVLVGTDSHNPFVFHGSSVVEEMELMAQAGYTRAELLETATRGAADYLGLPDRGRVDVGCVADLVAVSGDPHTSISALRNPAAVVVAGSVLERPDLERLLEEAEELLQASPDPSRLRPVPEDEELVGDYERTNFGMTDALTRVSVTRSGSSSTTTWREQVVTRHRTETRVSAIDADGVLASAEVVRERPEGGESARVVRAEGDRYVVRTSTLDGSGVVGEITGPLLPGADLGVPAMLAAIGATAEATPQAAVLTLSASLANGLLPTPGRFEPAEDGADRVVQHTTDALVRVQGGEDLDSYGVSAPMVEVRHRRLG